MRSPRALCVTRRPARRDQLRVRAEPRPFCMRRCDWLLARGAVTGICAKELQAVKMLFNRVLCTLQTQFSTAATMDSFAHQCQRPDVSDSDTRSRHNSASCGGCNDCEAADALLSMHQQSCNVPAVTARKPVLPPRLRYRKQYKQNMMEIEAMQNSDTESERTRMVSL